jgi:diguanylate cyclase (GGDEF)-like protein
MASLILDTRTLAFVLIAVCILLSLIMTLLLKTRKTYPGFGLWTAGSILYATGFILLFFRRVLPDFITILAANTSLLAAAVCLFEGIRRFRGAGHRWVLSITVLVLQAVMLTYFTYVDNRLEMRIVIYSFLTAGMYFLCAMELLRKIPTQLRTTSSLAGVLFIVYGLILVARAIITRFSPVPHDLFASSELQTVVFLASLLLGLSWMFSFVSLNGERLEMELNNAQVELQRLAHTDFVTGVSNNRSFFETGEAEFLRARRLRHPLGILMLDIDNFKTINDIYGHAAGDKVLAAMASVCRKNLRGVDTFGRLGGDEFAALLPEIEHAGCINAAERLRLALETTDIGISDSATLRITACIGASLLLPQDDHFKAALHRADAALYEAKRSGRNRVCERIS